MQVLYLGNGDPQIINILSRYGDRVLVTDQRISRKCQEVTHSDFLVSYGYRFILKEEVLTRFQERAINIHISLLPWNRGADANLWSFLEDTPKGVTIHHLDSGIDTGKIFVQESISFDRNETLRSSYEKLSEIAVKLLDSCWKSMRSGAVSSFSQVEGGSFHRLSDKLPYLYLLEQGWDTPVTYLTGKALPCNI